MERAGAASDQGIFAGEGLTQLRGERLVFRQLDFTLAAGEALLLVGANGSGKTTLLRTLAGLSRPFAGTLSWDGQPLRADPEAHARRTLYLGHQPGLKPTLSAQENLRFEAALAGAPAAAVESALEALALRRLAALPWRVLSAGQRRRVALARLLLRPVSLWLLDEPATSLDSANEARLWDLCRDHLARGGRLAVASHAAVPLPGQRTLPLDDYAAFAPPAETRPGGGAA